MYDAWTIAGVGGGAAALTYLATGWKQKEEGGGYTMRLSLAKNQALLGDVRLIGGVGAALTSMYVKGPQTKKGLQVVATASLLSLGMTELIRWQLARKNVQGIAKNLEIFPAMWQRATHQTMGALPGPASAPTYARQREAAWANR